MKKIWIFALALLLCAGCFVSCDSIMQDVGKYVSVEALDELQLELEKADFDEFKRYGENDEGEIARFEDALKAELAKQDKTLTGEITGVIEASYNKDSDPWVYQLVIGISSTDDAETLVQYYQSVYAEEVEEGKAEIVGGGWLVNVTVSSIKLEEATTAEE